MCDGTLTLCQLRNGEWELEILKLHFCLKLLYQQGVISIESWMTPFLKTNMVDSVKLSEIENSKQIVEDYLDSIESLVLQYIKNEEILFNFNIL